MSRQLMLRQWLGGERNEHTNTGTLDRGEICAQIAVQPRLPHACSGWGDPSNEAVVCTHMWVPGAGAAPGDTTIAEARSSGKSCFRSKGAGQLRLLRHAPCLRGRSCVWRPSKGSSATGVWLRRRRLVERPRGRITKFLAPARETHAIPPARSEPGTLKRRAHRRDIARIAHGPGGAVPDCAKHVEVAERDSVARRNSAEITRTAGGTAVAQSDVWVRSEL